MSLSTVLSTVARLQKDLADLRVKEAEEARREAEFAYKATKAAADTRSTKSASILASKVREAERYSKELAAVQKRRATLAQRIAFKLQSLNRSMADQAREAERERRLAAEDERRIQEKRNKQFKELERRLAGASRAPTSSRNGEAKESRYDVFISHASEDKGGFANGLATKLMERGVDVWYDDMVLGWGDSLRRSIDKGLANSRFGIVILSEHFFRKEWPQRELDGLVQLETAGQSRILPIWHKISKDEVVKASPTLADKLALNTSFMTTEEIVDEIEKLIGKG